MLALVKGRIILQDLGTHQYLGKDGLWTASCQEAKLFEQAYQALQEGLDRTGKRTQVVWCFQDPTENLYMLVDPNQDDSVHPCISCGLTNRSTTAHGRPIPQASATL